MSSIIVQQQLRECLLAISSYVNQTPTIEALPDESSSLDSVCLTAERLSRKLTQAQSLLQDWTAILSNSVKEIREEEMDLFSAFVVDKETPSEVMSQGSDVQTRLDLKIDRIRARSNQSIPNGAHPNNHARPLINLPALQLPDFDGHEENWPSFWAAFSHTIHDNSALTGAQKLTYLVGRLRGNSRALIDGFALTDHNYPIVIDLLKSRFGDDQKRADRLRSELFHLAKPSGHSNSLRIFSENVDRICRQLESLGNNLDDNPFLTVAIKEKLPTEVKAQLYDKEMEEGTPWSSKQWRERLVRVVRLREAIHAPWDISASQTHPQPPKSPSRQIEPIKRVFPVIAEPRKSILRNCSLCLREGHQPSNCMVYRSAEQRIARLTEQGRCLFCAREGHRRDTCSSTVLCFRCGGRHHVWICPEQNKVPIKGSNSIPLGQRTPVVGGHNAHVTNPVAPPREESITTRIVSAVTRNDTFDSFSEQIPEGQTHPTAYLMVKEIKVFNNNGPIPVPVSIFFDPGSQPDFIASDLVSLINPKLIKNEKMAVRGFSGNAPSEMHFDSPRFSVRLKRRDGGWETVELNQTDEIVPPIEFVNEICWNQSELTKIGISVKRPQILLGVKQFWKFFLGKREVLPCLFQIDTVFGPFYGGQLTHFSPSPVIPSTHSPLVCNVIVAAPKPEELIKKLWSLESIGIRDPLDPNDDELALDLFKDSVTFREGRYEVGWPWRPGGKDRLPNNFSLAYSRLSGLSVKLRTHPEFRERYQATISEQLRGGIIEPAARTGVFEHFIPHHAVINPKKLRVVYDASAREKGKASLNDLLLPGPNLVPELAGILLRFRSSVYPALGDIEKAFLAVGLREEDREAAKFLWLKDPSLPLSPDNLQIYRFTRIAFGVNSSPFLLASVLRHHLSSIGDPLGMIKNFYVDNLLICSETASEAAAAVQTARKTMSIADMNLREFVAADPTILKDLPPETVLVGETQKVLGISWSLPRDQLIFELPNPSEFSSTRRGVLSAVASLFDPLGLCSPCLVKAKLFFQSLWDLGKGWDEPIGEEYENIWRSITSEWKGSPLTFDRLTFSSQATLQLHIFSDAGPNSFATAVYLRAEHNDDAKISLLFSKSRLRPKKARNDGLTIPRLELLGLIIAVRAKNFVVANFGRSFEKTVFWVDSQIVLSWLANPAPQPVFIANRLSEIRCEREAFFRYVRSSDNPSDLGTRGVSQAELRESRLWHFGPNWLKQPERDWPNEFREITLPTDVPAGPKEGSSLTVAPIQTCPADISRLDPTRFHSWTKLIITITFVLCFISKLLGKGEKLKKLFPLLSKLEGADPSSFAARTVAKIWILKREQAETHPGEGTFLGDDGLIRLRTRMANAQQPSNFKNPVILPRESWVTRLLILSAHHSVAHAGIDYTLTKFLSEFWCMRARRLVKSVLRECTICKRDKAVKFALPPMPQLPSVRTIPSPPFTFVGLDYLGPTLFKSPEGPKKAWILLLTCLSCRAVHLELVDSLNASDFLAAFRRFVARRGTPKRVWSDNGTQLVLGRQLLMAYYDLPVEWKLIPPQSPWAGGVYERMVGIVKTAFRRCLGRSSPTWTQLQTLLCEIEAIVNGRPITFVSDEKDGPKPLRPLDFLSPHSQNTMIEPNEPDKPFNPSPPEKLAHLWFLTNESLRHFWQIWSRDYLLILRGRTQDTHAGPRISVPGPPRIGEVVLIQQEDFPRNHWPLGRILELFPPEKPRSAKVLLADKRELVRSINHLVPLEAVPEWEEVPTGDHPMEREKRERTKRGKESPPRKMKWADRPPLPAGSQPMKKGAPLGFRWAKRHPLASALLSVVLFVATAAASPRMVTCDEQGIWLFLNPKAENALICCEGICSSRKHTIPYLLPLPSDLLASGFECHISYSIAGEKISSKVQCDPVEGCNLIKCYLCWDRILNPHCSPLLLAFILGTIFGVVGIILCICVLGSLRWWRGLGRWPELSFFHKKSARGERPEPSVRFRLGSSDVEGSEEGSELSLNLGNQPIEAVTNDPLFSHPQTSRPRRLTRLGYALAPSFFGIVLVFIWVSSAWAGLEVMSISANTEECSVDHDSTTCSFNSVTSLTLLPVGQKVELIFHTPHIVPMGSLFFVAKGLSLQCVKESRGWTRSFRVNISSVLRCPAAGSCVGSFCSDLEPHQSVTELGEEFPGLNFCQEASGFLFRGCLSPSAACLFYRIFAENVSTFVYELIQCPSWQFHLRLIITLEIKGAAYSEEIDLFPGITHHWNIANLSLVFSPSGLPPLPFLGKSFITNRTHAAVAPEWLTHLLCESELAAAHSNCSLAPDVCHSCHTHYGAAVVKCLCRGQYNIEKAMADPLKKLPISVGHLQIEYGDRGIQSAFPYSPVNLLVKMRGTRLAVRHASAKCTIFPGRLKGCHSCRTGGRFNYTCASSQGESFASIECADGTMWVTRCHPKGHSDSVVLSWSHPDVKTRCRVDCSGEKTYFELEGRLMFLLSREEDYFSLSSAQGKKGTYTGGVTLPQIKFALFQSVGSVTQAVLAVTVGVSWLILFLIAVRFCPLIGLSMLCRPQAPAGVVLARAAKKRRPGRRARKTRNYNRAQTM